MEHLAERLGTNDFVGFWKRVLISFLDFLILALPGYLLNRLAVSATEQFHTYVPQLIHWGLLAAFNIYMVVKFGGTPGKLLLKVRIIGRDGANPTLKQAVVRDCFFIINSFLATIAVTGDEKYHSISSYLYHW